MRPGSPCIDSGTSEGAPDTDIEGYKRPYGSKYDMGAYEYSLCDPTNVIPEVCDNMDNDCDGFIDEDFNAGAICTVGIGFCKKEGIIVCKEDGSGAECNVTPGDPLPEVCNGRDDDCDGDVDDNVRRPCTTSEGPGTQICQNGLWGPCITPQPEVCDGIDNDLDGLIDEGVKITYFWDEDKDGYGNSEETVETCEAPPGYVVDNGDCDDSNPERYPGNTEVCDGKDNDCDALIDEDAQDCIIYYKDEDQDGYGLETDNRCLCHPDITNKYITTQPGDPDDKDPQIPVADITTHLDLPAGWSMISLPVRPLTMVMSELFPQAVVVYAYKKGFGYVRVQKAENLEIGTGYWILFNKAQRCSLTGKPVHGYIKTVYDNGWYMIGGCAYPAKASTDRCNIGVIYGYIQGTGYKQIFSGENIEFGRGYWILLNNIMDQANLVITGSEPIPEIDLISLSVDPKDFSFTSTGQTHQLVVTGQYSDGNSADLTNSSTGTTYTSSDTSIVTVDNDGIVSVAGNGSAIITATNSGISDSSNVIVNIFDEPLGIEILEPYDQQKIVLNTSTISVKGLIIGDPEQVNINGEPAKIDDLYGTTFSADLNLSSSDNTITVEAIRGEETSNDSVTVIFTPDNEAPIINNIAPTGPVKSNSISISGNVSHSTTDTVLNDEIFVMVNSIPADVDIGTGDFSAFGIEIDTNSTLLNPDEVEIVAIDSQGNESTSLLSVYYNGDPEDPAQVFLSTNQTSGPAPLSVVFDITITKLSTNSGTLNFGDGNSITVMDGKSITHTYYEEKIFHPILNVLDGSIKYTYSIPIYVDVTEANANIKIQECWSKFKNSLLNKSFPIEERIDYSLENFTELGKMRHIKFFHIIKDDLENAINSMEKITPIKIMNNMAIYNLERKLFGVTVLFQIIFHRDLRDSSWKIHDL